jgi:hypothetical protein
VARNVLVAFVEEGLVMMTKKDGSRKLQLTRETLCPMTPDELGGVHGGTSPVIPAISASVRMSSQVCGRIASEGIKWASRAVLSAFSAYSAVHRSEHCGPTNGGPQPQPPQPQPQGGQPRH